MEHEKIISEKILLEEQTPIRWDKDRVWQSIPLQKQGRRYGVYYIAAGIALLSLIITYLVQVNIEKETLERIALLESKIKALSSAETEQPEQVSVAEEACEETPEFLDTPSHDENSLRQVPLIVTVTPLDSSIILVAEEIPVKDSVVVAVAESPVTEEDPKIEAIIGVIPEKRPTVVFIRSKKSEKLRINFSREHPGLVSPDREKHTLTARIN